MRLLLGNVACGLLVTGVIGCGSHSAPSPDGPQLTEPAPENGGQDSRSIPPPPPSEGATKPKSESSTDQPSTESSTPQVPPEGASASEHNAYFLKIEWLAGPTADGESRIHLSFSGVDGKSATNVTNLSFKPWMTTHGHGAPEKSIRSNAVPGTTHQIVISGVYFSMSGPWDLKIAARVNGADDNIVIPVNVP